MQGKKTYNREYQPYDLKDYDAIEIHGCKEFYESWGSFTEQVDDDQAEFWSVYGHYREDNPKRCLGIDCLADFNTKKEAESYAKKLEGSLK